MNPQFSQPKGAVSKETNKDSIARKFGCKKSEVLYAKTGAGLTGYKVIYDKVSQRSYALPSNLPAGATITSMTDGILVHNTGTVDLGALAALRGEFVTLVENFTTGFTIKVRNEIVSDGTNLYRWKGTLPKTVNAGATVANTGGVSDTAWGYDVFPNLKNVGAEVVGYKKSATGAILSSISKRFQKVYDAVADFGADPTGQVDSYAALQAWADACVADNWATAQINGIFKISQPILFHNILGLTIVADCYIYPTYDTGDYVVGWCNGQGVRTVGRMEVSGQSKIGIKTGHKIWSDTSQGFSFSYFYGLNASDVLCGIQVGDTAYPDALLSEMSFIGGFTVGTPCAIRAIGTQCYINFNNFDAVSGAPGGLSAVTQYTIHNIGAQVKYIGGEIQHNNNILGAAVLMQPIVSATYGNQVGCFESLSTHIENQATLALIYNIDNVATPVTKKSVVSFVGSHGFHNQDNGGLIVVHDTIKPVFEGTIVTRDIGFYTTTTTRTQPNIVAGPKTIVDYDPKGFGPGFVKGLQAVSGGILLFKRRVIYCARNTNGQSVGTSNTVLVYAEPQTSDDFYRWVTNYSAGRFTVPAGGLKNVEVNANLRVASGNIQLDVYVDSTLKTLSSPASSINSVRVYLGDLNEGQIIDVRGTASAATTTNGGGLEFMTITAER